MVSEEMKQRAEALLSHSLMRSLVNAEHAWCIETIPHEGIEAKECIVLTISTYTFRALLFFHFTLNDSNCAYIERCLGVAHSLENDKYYDYLCELGNNFCGAFKRELGVTYAHLGMSTPNILSGEAAKHVNHFRCGLQLTQQATCDDVCFYSCLHICAEGEEDILFPTLEEVPEADNGELELF